MTTIDEAPVPYRPARPARRRMSSRAKVLAGYSLYFIAALSMFGAMILLSLL